MTRRLVFMIALGICRTAFACQYADEITTAAKSAGLPPRVMIAIAMAESSCRAEAFNPKNGERGLFQFTETTWKRYSNKPFSEAFNPHENIKAAVKHLTHADKSDPRNILSLENAGVRDWRKLNPKWSINHPNRIYRAIYRGEPV